MKLRKYQEEDVQRIIAHNCIGVFNEQRTGKTPTTCVSLLRRNLKHVLVVCPASLQYVWKQQYELWTNNQAFIIPDTSFDLNQIPYDTCVIINYEKLRGDKNRVGYYDRLVKWKPDAVVIDEAHRMKDRKSLTSKALFKFIKVPVRIALTGTPATNKPWDVWSILHWLFPTEYKSYWKFIEEYFVEDVVWVHGAAHKKPASFRQGMAEILQMNLDTLCIQRKRREVMQWLPKEEPPTQILLPATTIQLNAIDSLIKHFRYENIITQTLLDNLIRVRQICADPSILGIKSKSPKIDWLNQYIEDYPEKSILVFSNSKKFLKNIAKKLKVPNDTICGDVPSAERLDIVDAFQDGSLKILLLQTQSGKEGLTLDQADTTIFLDTYPPAADYLQAKDRMVATTPPERNKPKEIIHVMMQGTYDEKTFTQVLNNVTEAEIINDYKKYIEERRK